VYGAGTELVSSVPDRPVEDEGEAD
jgi:hypothetical protein